MIWGLPPQALRLVLKELSRTMPPVPRCRVSFVLPESLVVQLRTETTRGVSDGNGGARRGQQQVGNFETVTFDENSMHDRLVEGVNDAEIRCPAQRRRTSQQTGIRC